MERPSIDAARKNVFINECTKCLIFAVFLTAPVFANAALPAERIVAMSLAELRASLDTEAITSAEIVGAYLNRIKIDNDQNKTIKAVIAINEHALKQAQSWDARRAQNPSQKNAPLAGIPFLVKDNFNTVGMPTTGGSVALASSIPPTNAFVVQKLLDEGAILLGKTNLSELAASYGWYGYSSMGGQTLNPLNPLRSADGSSSGSAAAVAAHFGPFALGTDTTASIRAPASVTGAVGMRTTLGLISRSGIIPASLTADIVGVITRNVEDQAIVLDVIRGVDKEDASTGNVVNPEMSFASELNASSLAGKTIAVVDNFDGSNPDVDEVKKSSLLLMEKAGAKVIHISLPKRYESLQPAVLGPIGLAEFRPQFEAYLSKLAPGQPKDMNEFMSLLSQRTENGSRTINPARYKGLVENLETKTTDSPEYIRLLTVVIPSLRQELTELMNAGRYDALFFPTISCTAPVVHGQSDHSFVCKNYAYAAAKISSATGFPEITVNAGKGVGNMPIGMSFLGKAGDDNNILKLAAAFEKLRK